MKLQTAETYLKALRESRVPIDKGYELAPWVNAQLERTRVALLDELLEEIALEKVAQQQSTERLAKLGLD